jgi:hypothetical protein
MFYARIFLTQRAQGITQRTQGLSDSGDQLSNSITTVDYSPPTKSQGRIQKALNRALVEINEKHGFIDRTGQDRKRNRK